MAQPANYDVTILVNDVDVTQYVPAESMSLDDYARQVSTFRFTISNPSGITPAHMHSVVITANSLPDTPVIFTGYIFELKTSKRDNGITVEYDCDCQDMKALLQRSILGGNEFTGSDLDILGDLLSNAYPDLSGFFDFSTDINSLMDDLSFLVEDGTTLLDGLNNLADLVDAEWRFENPAPPGSTGSQTVTFDAVGYANYTLNAGTVTPTEQAVGNPDDCVRASGSAGSNAARNYNVDVNLGGTVDVTSVGLDIWHLSQRLDASFISSSVIVTFYSGVSAQDSIRITLGTAIDQMWVTTPEYDLTGSNPGGYIEDWLLSTWATGIPCDRVNFQILSFLTVATWDLRMDNMIITYSGGVETNNLQWDNEPDAANYDIDVQLGDEYASDIDFTIGSLDNFNSVTVVGGYEEVTITKQLDNDGVRDHIGLPYPVKSLAVYLNTGTDTTPVWGSALALGAWGSDTLTGDGGTKDVLLDAEHNVLFFDTTPPNLVNAYKITGTIQRPIRVRVESVADGDLTLATSYADEKITSIDQAVAIGQAQLEQKNAIRQLSFKTNHPGLKPGQSITVADSARGLSELVTIRRISTTWKGPIGFFDVDCGDDDENSVDAMIANNDKRTRASGITTSPDTQTASLYTDNSGNIMTDNGNHYLYEVV